MNSKTINCKNIFQKAYDKRYTWKDNFQGYKGKCIYSVENDLYEGNFVLGKDCKPEVQKIDDYEIVKIISSQLFEVAIHRLKRDFLSIHSKNNFNLLKNSEKGIEMKVSGKNDGDKYRVKDDCINMVYRKIHGTIIEIYVQEFFDTGSGFLSKKYTSQQFDPKTLLPKSKKLFYEDNFIKIGSNGFWVLNSRIISTSIQTNSGGISKFIFEDVEELS